MRYLAIRENLFKSRATIFLFGDLQMGANGFRDDLWQNMKKRFLHNPNSFALGLGDYSDFARMTDRDALQSVLNRNQSLRQQQDDMVMDKVIKISEMLSFMKGRILGLHLGHHDWEFISGGNMTTRLCEILKCAYMGFEAMWILKLNHGKPTSKNHSNNLKIYSTHGSANGRNQTAPMNQLAANIVPYWPNCAMYITAHACRGGSLPIPHNDLIDSAEAPIPVKSTRYIIQNSGFMEGRPIDEDSYVGRKNMPDVSLGWTEIDIIRHTTGNGRNLHQIDLHPNHLGDGIVLSQ